jgi:hypothetical protein
MELVVEIMRLVLPAGAVFAAAYLLVQRFLEADQRRRELELRRQTHQTITPLKLQAYERLVIFLERINPSTLVVRVNKNGMKSHQFHSELVKTIRSEFEHNLAQQIYVSHGAWELVRNAKEEISKLVNITAGKMVPEATSNELAMAILEIASSLGKKLPNEIALEYLRKEVAQNFG